MLIDSSRDVTTIKIDLKLSTLKPLNLKTLITPLYYRIGSNPILTTILSVFRVHQIIFHSSTISYAEFQNNVREILNLAYANALRRAFG